MKFTRRAVVLSIAALAGLVPAAATSATAASARLTRSTANAVAGCGVAAAIPVGGAPFWIAAKGRTNTIYVANQGGDTVSVIKARTNTVTATIPVSVRPPGATVNTRTAYVANAVDGTVSALAGCRG